MSVIKLWYSPGACSLVPHILLYDVGLPFEAIETLVSQGAPLTEAFARINPKKRVPVLSLDEAIVTEVPAIATAISHLAPERHLMGRTPMEQVRVLEWMNWLSGDLHGQGFGGLFRPQRFTDDTDALAGVKEKSRQRIQECFAIIESKLSSPFVVGESLTVVDPYLLVFYRWGNSSNFDMQKNYRKFTHYAQGISEHPAVAGAMAAEGISH